MDMGYDSERIHFLIRDELFAESIIPIRLWGNSIPYDKCRREM